MASGRSEAQSPGVANPDLTLPRVIPDQMSDAPYSARMTTKPSDPRKAPKSHGRKPSQPGYQGRTRSLASEFPCAVIAVLALAGAGLLLAAGVASMVMVS